MDAPVRPAAANPSALTEESPAATETPGLRWAGAPGVDPAASAAVVEGEGEEDPCETSQPRRTSLDL